MDTASTLIGLGLLAVFVLPILFLIWQQNTKEKSRLRNLKELSIKNNLTTDTVEISATLLLGLDSKAKKLLVIEPTNNMQHQVLDLSFIKNTKVSSQPFPDKPELIKRISLDLSENRNNKKLTEIIFYDEDDNASNNASERLIVAQKWNRIISEKLSA
ncbi:hypothetical protein [Salegentibacter salegens]|uniref:Uncharacterized protein n=1 Tax=Salegentibacter salegens TaxID=143223 RepID=A0A1M7MJT0_9FLAO|nr:hypothetical protein [Salegentibacter salegens]PRX48165.1 hypothetical protein LY58_01276 [Salegentibacter salegens]SHM91135.1 hypothetical protein SAMN05878281_2524 [Salegentibacter salegens]